MRLLFFADLHLDAPFAWAGPALGRRRRLALREALERVCDLATGLRVDALCCGGDLYEQERFTPDTAAFLRDQFAQLHPLPVYLAPGNHDWLGPSSLYRHVSFTDNVHLFTGAALSPVTLAEGLTLWGAAHQAPAGTPDPLSGFHTDRSGVHLALFHGSERGGLAQQGERKTPHAPFTASEVRAGGLHHALVGHYHVPRDADELTYPGNPEPLAFGETGPRGAVLLTVASDGSVTRERHRVAVSEVSDIEVDVTGAVHSGQVRELVARRLATAAGTVRVTLCGEIHPDVEIQLCDLAGVAPHLDPPPLLRAGRISVGYDWEALRQERTVRGQFVRDVLAAEQLSEPERARVLVTGVRALDGRADLDPWTPSTDGAPTDGAPTDGAPTDGAPTDEAGQC